MEPVAKITISPEELARLQDTAFLVSKRVITEKVYSLFHQLKKELAASTLFNTFSFPEGVDIGTGKLTRGENYRGLPYVVMDFPQAFGQGGIFAFRVMLWWGREFSFTLHLSGAHMQLAQGKPMNKLHGHSVYQCVNASPWEHHFEQDNYLPVEIAEPTAGADFIKVARRLPVTDWDKVPAYGLETLELYLRWLR